MVLTYDKCNLLINFKNYFKCFHFNLLDLDLCRELLEHILEVHRLYNTQSVIARLYLDAVKSNPQPNVKQVGYIADMLLHLDPWLVEYAQESKEIINKKLSTLVEKF